MDAHQKAVAEALQELEAHAATRISDELLARYSQWSRQRDEATSQFVARNGRQPTDNEVAVLVRNSRADKLIEISTEEVRAGQLAR